MQIARRYLLPDGRPRWELPFDVAALIETQELLVDEAAETTWAALDKSRQDALLFWINTPRFNRGRRGRRDEAVRALQAGTVRSGLEGPSLLDLIFDALLPW